MIQKYKAITLALSFLTGLIIFSDTKVEAATLRFDLNKKDAAIGEVFPLEVLLNADDKDLNAVNIKISVQNNNLKLKDWSDGGSIINYWAEKPRVDEAGNLEFQGVMLGGFSSQDGKVLTLYYEALKTGNVTINFESSSAAYLNDGKGTEDGLSYTGAVINISSEIFSGTSNVSGSDVTIPETLEAQISRSKDVFDGKYFLVFAAEDNESGIDYVEIKEGDESWVRAESPYLLKNQKLDKDVLVKAVDKSGNSRTETLKLRQYQIIKNTIYLAVLIVVVLALWQVLRRRKVNRNLA